MSAIEVIQRAIERLKELKADSTPGEWWATRDLKWPSLFAGAGLSDDVMVASDCRLPGDAALIVMLSRTVEPMLDILDTEARRIIQNGSLREDQTHFDALALARAILGEEA